MALLIFLTLIGTIVVMFARALDDVITLSMLVFLLFYGFRALLLVTGLDAPFPDYLFTTQRTQALVLWSLVLLSGFLVAFMAGLVATTRGSARTGAPFFLDVEPPLHRMQTLTVALTVISIGTTGTLLLHYGGVGELILASKVDKDLAGLFILKTPLLVGAVVATATWLDMRRLRRGRGFWQLGVGACALLNGALVFTWGQRSALVVVVAMMVLGGGRRFARRQDRARRQNLARSLFRVALAALLVVGVAAGLRIARDTVTRGEVISAYAEGNVYRQMSLGANATYFDASMLAFRDWPRLQQFRDGEDFVNGLVGPIPRALWAEKPESIVPGRWFRQVYEPQQENGWPVGSPTLWYLNFGLVGILIGGLISGVALGWVARRQRAGCVSGINTGMALVIAVYALQLGWSSDAPLRIAAWLVPFLPVLWWLRRPVHGRATNAQGLPRRPVLLDERDALR